MFFTKPVCLLPSGNFVSIVLHGSSLSCLMDKLILRFSLSSVTIFASCSSPNLKNSFALGDEHEAKIVTLDKENRKMSLSIKQLSEDPWSTIETKFPEGSRHTGLVKNITPYGVFVELAPGIGGMIHISDLSWLKRFNHQSEYIKVGHNIEVMILSIDKDNRKLQLGHKQLEEDPWNALENTFAVGTIHEGTTIRKDDKGAIVQLPYGLEGFAPG